MAETEVGKQTIGDLIKELIKEGRHDDAVEAMSRAGRDLAERHWRENGEKWQILKYGQAELPTKAETKRKAAALLARQFCAQCSTTQVEEKGQICSSCQNINERNADPRRGLFA